MATNLIPLDPLTRKLLAKVLAKMIAEDFRQARYGSANREPIPITPREDKRQRDQGPESERE